MPVLVIFAFVFLGIAYFEVFYSWLGYMNVMLGGEDVESELKESLAHSKIFIYSFLVLGVICIVAELIL